MDAEELLTRWRRDGFAILPGWLTAAELSAGLEDLGVLFPSAEEFHDDVDPQRNTRFRDEFGGITSFPFPSTELSLLAVHPRLIDLAEMLVGSTGLRAYSIEAWAKYTGAADYDQPHHRDYLNHTLLVPAPTGPSAQVEMFVYLVDVPPDLGPPAYLPSAATEGLPVLPNWYPRSEVSTDPDHPGWTAPVGHPELYAREVSAAGPKGTVVAYRIETFHRGTALTAPRGARYTLHVSLRRADADWIGRRGWPEAANSTEWTRFVRRASARQLGLFGFPPPGHPYWTDETLAGMALRYPGFDPGPWR